jgi:hypothetical protein
MAGPAFFFALCGFLDAIGGGVGLSEDHPPNDVRRNILYDQLVQPAGSSFADVFRTKTDMQLDAAVNSPLITPLPEYSLLAADLSRQMSASNGVAASDKAFICTELCRFIPQIAAPVYAQARSDLKTVNPRLLYGVAHFERDIDCHLEPLLNAIPPIESTEPGKVPVACEFATILNVGWVTLLTQLDKLQVTITAEDNSNIQRAEALNALLLKAVELSEARRRWSGS